MRKTFLTIFLAAMLVFGAMTVDYVLNSKEKPVSLHSVKTADIQESFSIHGNITRVGNINYITGKTKEPLKITEGAQASVYVDGIYYDGYLQSLEKISPSVYNACVSVISEEELIGEAEAHIYGDIDDNVILIPASCIFRDEKGKESVMVVTNNFCVKRNIVLGKIKNEKMLQVSEGLFENEKVILNPEGLKTGDKVYSTSTN